MLIDTEVFDLENAMSNTNHATASVLVTGLVIAGTLVFAGSFEFPSTEALEVHTKPSWQVVDIELDELAVSFSRKEPFTLEKVPQSIRKLTDRRIRIRGYMFPTFEETGIVEFILNGETKANVAGFGAGLDYIPIHYLIDVSLREGIDVEYTSEPFIIEGIFSIEPDFSNGELMILFRIDDATLKPVRPRDGYYPAVGLVC